MSQTKEVNPLQRVGAILKENMTLVEELACQEEEKIAYLDRLICRDSKRDSDVAQSSARTFPALLFNVKAQPQCGDICTPVDRGVLASPHSKFSCVNAFPTLPFEHDGVSRITDPSDFSLQLHPILGTAENS